MKQLGLDCGGLAALFMPFIQQAMGATKDGRVGA